jgi:hypothetical protein
MGAMEHAVMEELGDKPSPSAAYHYGSNGMDNMAGLADGDLNVTYYSSDTIPEPTQTMPPPVNYQPPSEIPYSPVLWSNPEPGSTPAFDASPLALNTALNNANQWLKSQPPVPAANPYTYHTPAGAVMGPPAPAGWTPTPAETPAAWPGLLVKSLDTTAKVGVPAATTAATAYFNYELAAQRSQNQPIYLQTPGAATAKSKNTDYTLLIAGGVVVIGVIAMLAVLATK